MRKAYGLCEGPGQVRTAGDDGVVKQEASDHYVVVLTSVFEMQSVVQVEDAQSYLRNVKRHLSEKQGLPAEHQRLTFAVAPAVSAPASSKPLPGSAESLLAGLSTWQVSITPAALAQATFGVTYVLPATSGKHKLVCV